MSAILTIKLTPKASRTAIEGIKERLIIARVTAPPVDGEANRALCDLLARTLQIPKSRVTIRSGASSRTKTVKVEGMALEDALERIERRL